MTSTAPLPTSLRARLTRRWIVRGIRQHDVRGVGRAIASFVAPGRVPPPEDLRRGILDKAVSADDATAARIVLADLADDPSGTRPRSPIAKRRAAAMTALARALPAGPARIETTVAAYLRGELAPRSVSTADGAAPLAAERAAALRAAGHPEPVVLATFPGFHANPYARLMERAYASHGLAAVHVDRPEDVDDIVAAAATGGYRAAVHVNAPDRFVTGVRDAAGADAEVETTLARIDGWLAAGAPLVTTIHNGPRYEGDKKGAAERRVAQGIVDRAAMVHVLAAGTARLLGGWITLDPSRTVHVPHPSYDGAYAAPPPRDEARAALGVAPGDGTIVVGLVGSLADRKGGLLLLDALDRVPERLADGREIRLVVAGMPSGRHSEALIRRAMADPRVITRIGFVPDAELPGLLASLDVAVVPYAQYLNSGWLHLALTAGCPAIAPAGGTPEEVTRPEALRTFAPGDPAALASALEHAGDLATPAARSAARASVKDLDPDAVSERFVGAFLRSIGRPAGGAEA